MFRVLIITSGILFSAVASAQTKLGTKPDLLSATSTPTAGSGSFLPLLQTFLVLGGVLFVLKAFGPKILSKFSKKLVGNSTGQIKVEESATFAGGSLYVVEARGKALLLCVGSNGVTCLSELGTPTQESAQPLFRELVEEAIEVQRQEPKPAFAAVVLENAEPEPSVLKLHSADKPETVKKTLLRNPEIESLRQRSKSNS